jgi:HTH-type transcriptional regulator/antitoxin HigA
MDALDHSMDDYLDLVRAFPLVPIMDDTHLDAAVAVASKLDDLANRSAAQDAYLGTLLVLIRMYEDEHVPIRQPGGVEMVTFLMEQHGLQQSDMDFAFGTRSVTSAVLHGKRPIGLAHARRLSERFRLPLDVFLRPAGEATKD